MNDSVRDYVETAVKNHPVAGAILEVGSLDINGTVRDLFSDRDRFPAYLGVDMRPGPGVDQVMRANHLDVETESVGCVVCCEMLEHDSRPWESVKEFARVLKAGGYLILTTCYIGKPRHDYPNDYWRFTPEGLNCLMDYAAFDPLRVWWLFGDPAHRMPAMMNRWAYSPDSLSTLLKESGFNRISVMAAQYHNPRRDFRIEARP
jgi:SAM-dependent methyltransferase